MAGPNVTSSLFFPKATISRSRSRYLHILEKQNARNLYVFLCESQPLITVTSYGLPKRCPICGQNCPIGSEEAGKK
jgi:hypothetical protein